MSDLFKIVLTSCLTLIGGLLLFSITKIFEKLCIDPLVNFNRIRSEIAQIQIFYAHKITQIIEWDNLEERKKVSNDILRMSSELGANILTIKFLWILKKFTFTSLSKINVLKAHKILANMAVDIEMNKIIDEKSFNNQLDDVEKYLKI